MGKFLFKHITFLMMFLAIPLVNLFVWLFDKKNRREYISIKWLWTAHYRSIKEAMKLDG